MNLSTDTLAILKNFSELKGKIDEKMEDMFDKNLGEPDEVTHFQDGHLFFEKQIWHTPNGDFVKIVQVKGDSTLCSMIELISFI